MVTLRDVAQRAGVVPSTASRALSGSPLISAQTTERVRRSAMELGYSVDLVARELATGRREAIGVMVPDIQNPFFGAIVKAIQSHARRRGFFTVVTDTSEDPAAETPVLRDLTSRVDHIVLCAPRSPDDEITTSLSAKNYILACREMAPLPSVTFDSRRGVHAAMTHLRELGHSKIAYVGGPAASWANHERERAFEDFDEGDGVRRLSRRVLGNFEPSQNGGAAAVDAILGWGATAVVAYNDLIAIGIMNNMRHRGVRVPDDLSLVGFDNGTIAALVTPALTTVAVPLYEVGRAAAKLLLDKAEDGDALRLEQSRASTARIRLPTRLVVRQSTSWARPASTTHCIRRASTRSHLPRTPRRPAATQTRAHDDGAHAISSVVTPPQPPETTTEGQSS